MHWAFSNNLTHFFWGRRENPYPSWHGEKRGKGEGIGESIKGKRRLSLSLFPFALHPPSPTPDSPFCTCARKRRNSPCSFTPWVNSLWQDEVLELETCQQFVLFLNEFNIVISIIFGEMCRIRSQVLWGHRWSRPKWFPGLRITRQRAVGLPSSDQRAASEKEKLCKFTVKGRIYCDSE